MTERLYYTDAYLTEFDARVIRVDGGERELVFLDRTAFYPTSGGQPHDVGRLGSATVREVVELADGEVAHVVDGALTAGAAVRGIVDWSRRFDHMQQHTGQHLFSAAFVHLLEAQTRSFHLGPRTSTVDLDRTIDLEDARGVEDETNRIIWENRPVAVRFADAADAAALPLRKESRRTGALRLIHVLDYDLSACGGTHVDRTGAVGLLAIVGVERYKGGTRVEFACGARALRAMRVLHDSVTGAVRLLSVLPPELPEAIGRLQEEHKALARATKALRNDLTEHEADALTRGAISMDDIRLVAAIVESGAPGDLKSLGRAIARRPHHAAVLVSRAAPLTVVAACAADTGLDAAELVRSLAKRYGGRGGGTPGLAQAGGFEVDAAAVLGTAHQLVQEQLARR